MDQEISLRHPTKEDGLKVYELVKSSPPLDLNSAYYYFIMCDDFSKSCLVAESNDEIIGFISGYIPQSPEKSQALFIWQVAVADKARGNGLASALLSTLVNEWRTAGIIEVKTTISPSNAASQKLFSSYANLNNYPISKSPYLTAGDFGSGDHEAEELYTIQVL